MGNGLCAKILSTSVGFVMSARAKAELGEAPAISEDNHTPHSDATVTNDTAFNSAAVFDVLYILENSPIFKINIAEAKAAAIHHKSPMTIGPPSVLNRAVPLTARKAEIQVCRAIFLLKNTAARKGTNLTFKYNKKALFEAVVVSRPMAWKAKPRKVYTPNSMPADHSPSLSTFSSPFSVLPSLEVIVLLMALNRAGLKSKVLLTNLQKFTMEVEGKDSMLCLMTTCWLPHRIATPFSRAYGNHEGVFALVGVTMKSAFSETISLSRWRCNEEKLRMEGRIELFILGTWSEQVNATTKKYTKQNLMAGLQMNDNKHAQCCLR